MDVNENSSQRAVIAWCKSREGDLPLLGMLYHTPSGMPTKRATAARFTGLGLRRGVPDLCLPVPTPTSHGLYVEMKSKAGHRTKPSPDQVDYLGKLAELGYRAVVCWSAEAAIWELFNQVVTHMSNSSRKKRQAARRAAIKQLKKHLGSDAEHDYHVTITYMPDLPGFTPKEQSVQAFVDFLDERAYAPGTEVRIGSAQYAVKYGTWEFPNPDQPGIHLPGLCWIGITLTKIGGETC